MLPDYPIVLLQILTQFTGGRGGVDNIVVSYGIAGLFYAVLFIIARVNYRNHLQAREYWLQWGFGFGLSRESFMFLMALLQALGLVDAVTLHSIFPPVEHFLYDNALIFIAGAYLRYFVNNPVISRRYLQYAVAANVVVYLATFWWWAGFIQAHPASRFGKVWCDWLFHSNGTFWLLSATIYIGVASHLKSRHIVTLALCLFTLSDFLKIPDMALDEVYENVFTPIARLSYLVGIFMLGIIYFREFICERNKAEQALQLESEKYAILVRNASDGVHVLDGDGNVLEASDAFCAMLGYNRDEVIGMNVSQWDTGSDPEELLQSVRRQFEQPARSQFERRHRRKDGSTFDVEISGYPLELNGRQVLFNSSRDISERKQASEALLQHRDRLEDLVEKRALDLQTAYSQLTDTQFAMERAGIGICWVDTETGQFVYANKYLADMLGYSIEEMLTKGVQDIDPNYPLDNFLEIVAWVRQNGCGQIESQGITKDGRLLSIDITLYYLPSKADSKAVLIAFITDITSRKEAEDALRQSKLKAESASLAKSNFLANMSHEIRTPMNGIIGMIDVLAQTPLTPEQSRMLRTIQNSSLGLLTILNDVLDFSKIEAGKLNVENVPTPLREVLVELWQLMGVDADRKNIQRELFIASDLPDWIFSDPMRLRQILFNLLSNAMKFVELGKGKVLLQVQSGTDATGQPIVQFRVVDNGIGMSQEMVDKLFQAFTQADESTARKYGGTGLGLSITQRLVKLLQGEIRVKSTLGLGTECTVELPLQAAPPGRLPVPMVLPAKDVAGITQTGAVSYSLPLAASAGAAANPHLILLAEDNEINREVMREQLSHLGYQVEMAEDGVAALAMWRSGRYALLLTDCQMPKLDGYGLAAAIRQAEPEGERLPIIAVTANALPGEKDRCLQSGMDDLLNKPFRLEELGRLMKTWLPLAEEVKPVVADAPPANNEAHIAAGFPIWDAEVLPRMLGDKPALHRQLLEKYLIDAQERVMTILEAGREEDLLQISRTAHALKSLARVVGAMELGEVCQYLEAQGKSSDAQGCQRVIAGLQAAFDLGADEIRRHLAEQL